LLDAFVAELLEAIEAVPEAQVPFASVKLSPEERMERYTEMRDNPQAWTEMLGDRGWPDTMEYARTMERKYREAD